MRRQFLQPIGGESVERVVGRLGAVQGQSEFGYELSINTRRATSRPGDVAESLLDGRLIRTFAFRGAVHLMTAETAAMYLALRASSRMWELASWQDFYQLKPSDWPAFRAAVRDALADGPLTRAELGAAVTRHSRYRHLGFVFTGDNWTLLKPLTWQGDMAFGPPHHGRATFQRLDSPHWKGLLDEEAAGVAAVEAYFSAYGPATAKHLQYWLGTGLGAGRKGLHRSIELLGDRLAEVNVDGDACLVLREHLDDLLGTTEVDVVRLLPGVDQWVMGPGTADPNVTPSAERAAVTRGSNVVISSGVVSGTWTLKKDVASVDWFAGAGQIPLDELVMEIDRLGRILGREITFHA